MGYVALKCPSFANRDSEAVFSEIFSCSIFDKLRMEEKHIFQTCYMLKGHCGKCGEDVTHLYLKMAKFIRSTCS